MLKNDESISGFLGLFLLLVVTIGWVFFPRVEVITGPAVETITDVQVRTCLDSGGTFSAWYPFPGAHSRTQCKIPEKIIDN